MLTTFLFKDLRLLIFNKALVLFSAIRDSNSELLGTSTDYGFPENCQILSGKFLADN